ncbi:hypothetical protein Tco_0717855 [Tanacetum coccineum]
MKKIKCLRGFRHTNDHGLVALTGINTVFLKLCAGFEFDKLALVWGKPRQPPLGPEEVRLAFSIILNHVVMHSQRIFTCKG